MRFILSVICFGICTVGYCQKNAKTTGPSIIEVAETIKYEISSDWTMTSDFKEKKTGTEFINFQRSPIQIDTVKAFIVTQSCKVENARGANIKTYSVARLSLFQKKKDFKIVKTFTHTDGLLQVSYTVGYWAYYTDDDGIIHKVAIIHGIHPNGFGFQFFIDCPKDIFPKLEQEITAQIRSISFL